MTNISEKILLYKVRTKRDADAFAILYDKYVERIYRFIYFKISHKQEAEDLTGDVFLKLWDYLTEETEKEVKSFNGLVYRIARNRVVDCYRDRAKKQECVLDDSVADYIQPSKDLMQGIVEKAESDYLLKIIKTLKQEYQEIILLRFIEELSIAEIAQVVDKKKTAVRVMLHRAMKKLKELVESEDKSLIKK